MYRIPLWNSVDCLLPIGAVLAAVNRGAKLSPLKTALRPQTGGGPKPRAALACNGAAQHDVMNRMGITMLVRRLAQVISSSLQANVVAIAGLGRWRARSLLNFNGSADVLIPMVHAVRSGVVIFAAALAALPLSSHAHSRGLYDTQQQAEQRARELGCSGTHQNSGKWMPCRDEADLHRHLRHQ